MAGPPRYVDTHAHLADPKLAHDLPAVLGRARDAGVVQVVAIATTAADSDEVLRLARGHRGVFATAGIHPNDAAEASPGDWDRIVALAADPLVVALGETGLDRYWDRTPWEVQVDSFERHLRLGRERDLPVVIHTRDCQRELLDLLARHGGPIRGILHSFTGTWDDAREALALGLHISFAGMITFANKALDPLRDAASRIPLDRLLVETDSPYLSPHPFRGRPNEPARVAVTAEYLARLRGLDPAVLGARTTENAQALFRLPEGHLLGTGEPIVGTG